jgi:cytochrome b subunit of formate dehydrogenase
MSYANELHAPGKPKAALFQRFSRMSRLLHALLMFSFLGLSLSGMLLRYSWTPWAKALAHALGGVHTAGLIHRLFALLMFAVFATHLIDLFRTSLRHGGWCAMLTGPNSMVPTFRDVGMFFASLRWFTGHGPRPRYGRYTYWEKFDYFAVFWGMLIIGSTGLIMCFPKTFSRFLSGEWQNVAVIIHSDEALLAVLFIFIIHFFNTHLRPDRFPMDMSIFTGYISVEDLQRERPEEYERLQSELLITGKSALPQSRLYILLARLYACLALLTGLAMLFLVARAILLPN